MILKIAIRHNPEKLGQVEEERILTGPGKERNPTGEASHLSYRGRADRRLLETRG